MTKIFHCCLLFSSFALGWMGCTSASNGPVSQVFQRDIASTEPFVQPQALPSPRELLAQASPWRGFEALDPLLSLVRLEKITKGCRGAMDRVSGLLPMPAAATIDAASLAKGWGAGDEDYLSAIEKCDSFPCGVKLNQAEVEALDKKSKKEREALFREQVLQRALKALKTGERKEYEFAGDPIDPFAFFVKKGFPALGTLLSGSGKLPGAQQVWARKLDLAPGKMRILRQVIQARIEKTATEVRLEMRDLYTAHYFDSWGEWVQVQCDPVVAGASPTPESGVLIQSLVVEFDLLKKNDLISRISKGKMRNGVRERGSQYLDQQAELILK